MPPSKDSLVETVAHPLVDGTFTMDARTGAPCKADRNRFSMALQSDPAPSLGHKPEDEGGPKSFMIVAGAKGVRCFADLGLDRVSKAEWPSKAGRVEGVQIVGRNASYALVVFTESKDVLVYSLPALEHMHTFPLPLTSSFTSSLTPSADTTGDFITFNTLSPSNNQGNALPGQVMTLNINTMFNLRRAYHEPLVALIEGARPIPAQPQPVGLGPAGIFSGLAWLGGLVGQETPTTGDQVDALCKLLVSTCMKF